MGEIVCPRCGNQVVKSGFVLRSGGKRQRYQCKECGHVFLEEKKEE